MKTIKELSLALIIALGCIALGCANGNPDATCMDEASAAYNTGCSSTNPMCYANGSVSYSTECVSGDVSQGQYYCCIVTLKHEQCLDKA
jgi:hypothetical protein